MRDQRVSEPMHSSIGPWAEAEAIYVNQAHFESRFATSKTSSLIIYDIGLGIAANALATLCAFSNHQRPRSLHLISFEADLAGIEVALKNQENFPFLRENESKIKRLLKEGTFLQETPEGGRLQWELHRGDFRDSIMNLRSRAPDLIYYDLYSPKVCPELWGYETFHHLFQVIQSKEQAPLGTTLLTYSSSTAARTALLLAGFHVGHGTSTSHKKETTVASTLIPQLKSPLGMEWLEHWKRSSHPLPPDCLESDKSRIEALLRSHIQAIKKEA